MAGFDSVLPFYLNIMKLYQQQINITIELTGKI